MGETIGAEVPESLRKRIDEYREDDESRSAAIERLIRDGFDDHPDNSIPVSTLIVAFGAVVLGISVEPVASTEFLLVVSGAAFLIAVAIERGIL